MEVRIVVFCAVASIGEFWGILLLFVLARYWQTPEVQVRTAPSMLLTVLFALAIIPVQALAVVTDFSRNESDPWIYIILSNVTCFVHGAVYLLRTWRLLFRYALAHQLEEYGKVITSGAHFVKLENWGASSWFVRQRRFSQGRWLLRLAFLLTCFDIFVCAMIYVLRTFDKTISISTCHVTIQALVVVCMGLAASRYGHDAVSILREYIYLGMGVAFIVFLVILVCSIPPLYSTIQLYYMMWAMLLVNFVPMAFGLSYPLLLAHKNSIFVRPENKTLEATLSNAKSFACFVAYLKTEFSSENAYFWQDVTRFRANALVHGAVDREEATRIFDLYISADAPMQVNVSASTRGRCFPKDADLVPGVFDDALKEIVDLMKRDSFPRFCKGRDTTISNFSREKSSFFDQAGLSTHASAAIQSSSSGSLPPS